jgi:NAD(P)-dependent dehydrogenase (short-subunit alcohol dehydrogenase family)
MTGSTFVIVGATGGIGSAVCRKLAAGGANLWLAARKPEPLAELAAGLMAAHPASTFATRTVDATRSADVDALFAEAGTVAGAANLVGSILLKPVHLTTDEEFDTTVLLNLRTAFAVTRAAAKAMTPTGGAIVLMSSVAATIGLTNHEAIAAAKAGVEGLVRSAAATYAPRGIRVNAVAPGLVRTPLAARITGNEASLKASVAMHPLGRVGEPADVAAAICWLLDPATTWVTGQVIGVDGGLGRVRAR